MRVIVAIIFCLLRNHLLSFFSLLYFAWELDLGGFKAEMEISFTWSFLSVSSEWSVTHGSENIRLQSWDLRQIFVSVQSKQNRYRWDKKVRWIVLGITLNATRWVIFVNESSIRLEAVKAFSLWKIETCNVSIVRGVLSNKEVTNRGVIWIKAFLWEVLTQRFLVV